MVVSIVTKIRILKQITTGRTFLKYTGSCIYSNKDKNFKANHNLSVEFILLAHVVSIVTKIRILKQITTNVGTELPYFSCIYSNKDKNFKANHNETEKAGKARSVVSIVTKIRILKQITTSIGARLTASSLYL